MDNKNEENQILIETELFDVLRAFHDLDDKEKRNQYVKEYTIEFCTKNNLDISKTIDKLKELFERKRRMNKMFPYEHYEGNNLSKIILEDEEKE